MPRKLVSVTPSPPLRTCKSCSASIEARPPQAVYCVECAEAQKQSRNWTEDTYRAKGFCEVLGPTRFKKAGTKERLRQIAEKKNLSIWELIQHWAWK